MTTYKSSDNSSDKETFEKLRKFADDYYSLKIFRDNQTQEGIFCDTEVKNPRDTDIKYFHLRYENDENIIETIKWCRKNFGNAGDGWDFTGTMHRSTVYIWNSRLLTMWHLYY